jgi:flagellar export protein FliJ
MMNDQKRLSRLVFVKRRIRDAHRNELAGASLAVARAEKHAQHADATLQLAIDRLTARGALTGDELALRAAAVRRAEDDLERAKERVQEKVADREERASDVRSSHREMRSLEVLADRLREDGVRREKRAEQTETDEVAGRTPGGIDR